MIQQKSILFINRVYPPQRGATGRMLCDLAEHCAKNGWQTTVLTTGEEQGIYQENGVRIVRIKGKQKPAHAFSYLMVLLRLFSAALKLQRSNIVITLSDPPLLVLLGDLFCLIKKTRHIHWSQDVYPDLFPVIGVKCPHFLQKWLQHKTRRAMNKAQKTVSIGQCMTQYLAHSGCNKANITTITNWPDFELYDNTPTTIPLAESAQHLHAKPHAEQLKTQQKFKILYAGTIGRAHPMDTILQAAHILQTECPDVEFVFVGEGTGFDALAKERAKRSLTNIRFMPYQPANRLKFTMESGDVHLISMYQDAAGLLVPSKAYSAIAVHRPCIFLGAQKSEIARMIKEYNTGVVVNQPDVQGLVNAIKTYRHSSEKWYKDYNGAVAAAQAHTPEISLKKWLSLLDSALL